MNNVRIELPSVSIYYIRLYRERRGRGGGREVKRELVREGGREGGKGGREGGREGKREGGRERGLLIEEYAVT